MLPKNFTKTTVRHKNTHAGTSMGTKRRNMKHHMDNSNKDSLRQKRKQAVHDKARSQGHLDEEMEMMGELILNQVIRVYHPEISCVGSSQFRGSTACNKEYFKHFPL